MRKYVVLLFNLNEDIKGIKKDILNSKYSDTADFGLKSKRDEEMGYKRIEFNTDDSNIEIEMFIIQLRKKHNIDIHLWIEDETGFYKLSGGKKIYE